MVACILFSVPVYLALREDWEFVILVVVVGVEEVAPAHYHHSSLITIQPEKAAAV